MSTQQSLYVDRRPRSVRRHRRRVDRLQLILVVAMLMMAIFASVQLNSLALALTR